MLFAFTPLLCLLHLPQVVLGHSHGTAASNDGPTPNFRKLVIAHGLISVFGFAVCLPAGVILARYLRTYRPWWYTGHWIAQFGIAGPIILIGVGLGYGASNQYGNLPAGENDGSDHKTLGTVILVLYLIQCALGAIIHYIKPKKSRGRPPQNYFHAVFGILVIALGMYQIHTGYDEEWPLYVGRGRLPSGVNTLWIVWTVLIAAAYAAGMWFIPKQYRQEAESRNQGMAVDRDDYTMGEVGA
ncbi:hypothetical protein B0H11DRAFT_1819831 [Mycena galericulata]|nr:hypothetical protein B0H11DRAFT_1819831 [Mycena galericulata]